MRTRRPAALLLVLLVVAGAARAATATDLVPPAIGDKPPAASTSTTAAFSFSHPNYTAFACSLDGEEFAPCASPTTYESLAEGGHTFAVHGVDAVGVPGDPATYSWTVDRTPPAAPGVTGPPARTGSTTAEIGFTHAEKGVTFLCRLDEGSEEPCTSPKTYSGLVEGGHTASVRARDAAGNVGAAASDAWTVDLTEPALTLTSPATGSATNDSAPVIAGTGGTAPGDGATVRIQIRQGAVTTGQPYRSLTATVDPVSGAWSVPVTPALPEGAYNVKAEQTDGAGNDAEAGPNAFFVDLTLPGAPAVTGPAARTRSTSAEIGFTHAETSVTFLCRLDEGSEEPCTSPKTYSGLAQGSHVVTVRARDAAGNVGPAASHAWTVDTTPPALALVSPSHGSSTNDTTPAVSGIAGTAPGDATSVQVQIRDGAATGGQPFRSLTASVSPANGAWSVSVSPALPEGAYNVKAEQSDTAGNSTETARNTFTVDLSLPSVALSAPANGTVTHERTPRFSGSSDQATVVLDVFAGSTPAGLPLHSLDVPVVGGAWTIVPGPALPDGVYTALARATNAAGTTSSSNATSFVIDNLPPTFTSVPEDLTLEQTARSGEVVAYTVAAEDALDPSPQIVCTPASGSTFPRGSTDVGCKVTDWAGLSAEDGFTVTVSNTFAPAPVASFAARPGNRVVRLSWLRPTDWDHARVIVSRAARGKASWKVLLRSATATSFADRTVRNDREYVYRVTSVDLAGNVSPVATARARPSAFLAPAWGEPVLAPPLLRWAKVKGARYYNVQVWRGGRKILSRWPAENRYKVTATWKFGGRRYTLKPGLYIVHAWPGFGPKARAAYGPRIGWTKFVVP